MVGDVMEDIDMDIRDREGFGNEKIEEIIYLRVNGEWIDKEKDKGMFIVISRGSSLSQDKLK